MNENTKTVFKEKRGEWENWVLTKLRNIFIEEPVLVEIKRIDLWSQYFIVIKKHKSKVLKEQYQICLEYKWIILRTKFSDWRKEDMKEKIKKIKDIYELEYFNWSRVINNKWEYKWIEKSINSEPILKWIENWTLVIIKKNLYWVLSSNFKNLAEIWKQDNFLIKSWSTCLIKEISTDRKRALLFSNVECSLKWDSNRRKREVFVPVDWNFLNNFVLLK